MNEPAAHPKKSHKVSKKKSWPRIHTQTLPSGQHSFWIDVRLKQDNGESVRYFKRFATLADAEEDAARLRDQRSREGKAAFDVPLSIRREAAKCIEKLKAYPGATLAEAVNYYVERKLRFNTAPPVGIAAEQIVAELTGRRGKRTVDNLRWYWTRFAKDFGARSFSDIEPDEITAWLDRTATHPETRHNYRRAIVRLFNIAVSKKWCQENTAAQSRQDDRLPPTPEVFTVEELARVLAHSDKHSLTPYIVLGTFAGIRVSELCRLDWQKVDLQERTVIVEAATTKTKTRRVVTLTDTAAAWLAPYVRKSGAVVDVVNLREKLHKLREAAKITRWTKNIMRHSFGSYALAEWQDVARVSYQMGNSPQVCKRHYEQVVKKSAAARFWALRPDTAGGKIIPMQTAANE